MFERKSILIVYLTVEWKLVIGKGRENQHADWKNQWTCQTGMVNLLDKFEVDFVFY